MPKKVKTLKISDFKPINLFTSLYKIITKVLSRRLRRVLHETIHISHPSFFFTLISTSFVFELKKKKKTNHISLGAFVEGRQIVDIVLIANEVMDEKRRLGRKGWSSKLILKRPMTMWIEVFCIMC